MADALSERLRTEAAGHRVADLVASDLMLEAATELDRREAIVAAVEALRTASYHSKYPSALDAQNAILIAIKNLLALLPDAALKG